MPTGPFDVTRLTDPELGTGPRVLLFEDTEIHARFLPASGPTDTLIVRFHGAVQRAHRALPAFQPNLPQLSHHGHQLTVCDPTMMTRDGFSLGWYAGHDGLDVQAVLRRFLARVAEVLETRRHVYLGSSGGGFAALHYSYHHAGSVALVLGPQTSIAAHTPATVANYMTNCWSGQTLDDISKTVNTDMCALYRGGHDNTVIYIQSTGDFLHNARHLAPFMEAIHDGSADDRQNSRFLPVLDYWGRPGHGGAIPHDVYIPWLRAALAARSGDGHDILAAYAPQGDKPAAQTPSPAPRPAKSDAATAARFDEDSMRMADRLRDYHLRQMGAT